jgi:hypothetical protein
MNHEDRRRDADLDRLMAQLPRERAPSAGFTDRVVAEFGGREPASRTVHLRRLAAAVAIFAAGLATGIVASGFVSTSTPPPAAPAPTSTSVNEVSQVNVPAIGHSEVWF